MRIHSDLLQLKRWNTPTICSGWDQITKRVPANLTVAGKKFGENVRRKFQRQGEW
jgi:hypothetical protein